MGGKMRLNPKGSTATQISRMRHASAIVAIIAFLHRKTKG